MSINSTSRMTFDGVVVVELVESADGTGGSTGKVVICGSSMVVSTGRSIENLLVRCDVL